MSSDDIRRSNVLSVVSGMLRISCGCGPTTLRPWYARYVAISVPKKKHSEPRKTHIASLR